MNFIFRDQCDQEIPNAFNAFGSPTKNDYMINFTNRSEPTKTVEKKNWFVISFAFLNLFLLLTLTFVKFRAQFAISDLSCASLCHFCKRV